LLYRDDEVFDELLDVPEKIRTFNTVKVAVIALATLIIEANDALPISAEIQAVLEVVLTRRNRLPKLPDAHLNDVTLRGDVLEIEDQLGLHVGIIAHTSDRKQATCRPASADFYDRERQFRISRSVTADFASS
jgi:hypothetical protein